MQKAGLMDRVREEKSTAADKENASPVNNDQIRGLRLGQLMSAREATMKAVGREGGGNSSLIGERQSGIFKGSSAPT